MDTLRCRTCHATGGSLRRGLCRACYLRAWRGAELPVGAACAVCPERRRIVLRWTKLAAGRGEASRIVTCHNCGFIADRMRPRPRSLDELKLRVARERRLNDRRRNYVVDPLDPAERRVAPRRARRRARV